MHVLEILMELNIIPILNKNRFSFSLFTLFLIHTCKEQMHSHKTHSMINKMCGRSDTLVYLCSSLWRKMKTTVSCKLVGKLNAYLFI